MDIKKRMKEFVQALDKREALSLVLSALRKLTYTRQQTGKLIEVFSKSKNGEWGSRLALATAAKRFQPKRYLEIGTERAISTSCVVIVCPNIEIWSYDIWVQMKGFPSSPEFVSGELKKCGFVGQIRYMGNSKNIVTQQLKHKFSLALVDGDHSKEGATRDLNNVGKYVEQGGIIIFDDISPLYDLPHLQAVWSSFKTDHKKEFLFAENYYRRGCGVAMKL